MDGNEKFWFGVWSVAAVFLLGCCAIGTIAGQLERKELTEMVKNGADPMRASCALGVGDGTRALCTVIAAQPKAP